MGCTSIWEKIELRDTCWGDSSNPFILGKEIQRSSFNKTRLKVIWGLSERFVWFDAEGERGGSLRQSEVDEQLDSYLVEEDKKGFYQHHEVKATKFKNS